MDMWLNERRDHRDWTCVCVCVRVTVCVVDVGDQQAGRLVAAGPWD